MGYVTLPVTLPAELIALIYKPQKGQIFNFDMGYVTLPDTLPAELQARIFKYEPIIHDFFKIASTAKQVLRMADVKSAQSLSRHKERPPIGRSFFVVNCQNALRTVALSK